MSKYQKKIGYDVEVITSTQGQGNGKIIDVNEQKTYLNDDGVKIIRLKYKGIKPFAKKFCHFENFYDTLVQSKPDILFIHGLSSIDLITVSRYLEDNPKIKVFVDNHVDFINSAKNILSREILHKRLWRYNAKILEPYVKKFYGVLPARVNFLTDVYKVPKEKTELLVLGVDDDLLEEVEASGTRDRIRKKLNIPEKSTLIVSGGKTDHNRPEIIQLMQAVNELHRDDIQLLVFGNYTDEYKESFESLAVSPFIHNAGWVNSKEIYEFFQAGDLIAFPGIHSVLWEQAVGSGKACVFRRMKGFDHVDLGGNCEFFDGLSSEKIMTKLLDIIDSGKLPEMTKAAVEKGRKYFSYREIAKRSIEA